MMAKQKKSMKTMSLSKSTTTIEITANVMGVTRHFRDCRTTLLVHELQTCQDRPIKKLYAVE
jgi:predicted MarR family transcription regulator